MKHSNQDTTENTNNILYQPSLEQIKQTNIFDFSKKFAKQLSLPDFSDYFSLYQASVDHNSEFWSAVWDHTEIIGQKGKTIIKDKDDFINTRFFPDSKLNFAKNILCKQTANDKSIIYQTEDKVERSLSSTELINQSLSIANYLKSIGIKERDVVAAYLPNMPETMIAAISSFTIGATFTSASPDFGADGIIDRFGQTKPKVLFITNAYFYNSKEIDLIEKSLSFLDKLPSLEKVIIIQNAKTKVDYSKFDGKKYQAIDYNSLISEQSLSDFEFEEFDFNIPLYILYSSGTTGKPKCIVHSAGGALIQHKKEHNLHCDIKPGDRVFYFTTCGWMMWNWLLSSLASSACVVLYDGSPFYPGASVLWNLVEKHKISFFGTSAKYLSTLNQLGYKPKEHHNLSHLKVIASTGSALLPEQFDFVYQDIKSNLLLASISGGTDIVSCFVLGAPNQPVRKGEIQVPGLGMKIGVLDAEGKENKTHEKGELACLAPFPSKPLGLFDDKNNEKFHATYFSKYPNIWHHGDYIAKQESGGYIIYGRSDTTLNPSGVRIGTAEIYRQIEQFDFVEISCAVDYPYRGDKVIIIFVKLKPNQVLSNERIDMIKHSLKVNCSPKHVPLKIIAVSDIPLTKTGKISEPAVRDAISNFEVANITALINPECLSEFKNNPQLPLDKK